MRVGWLADAGSTGGAELSQAEFRAAAPDDVEVVDCPPGAVQAGLDAYVIHNCVTYTVADLDVIREARVFKFWHDVGPHVRPDVMAWLDHHARQVCCSPLQAEAMRRSTALIPPPVDLARFREAAGRVNGSRAGTVSVASWMNPGKAPHLVQEWAAAHEPVAFFGAGPYAPSGSRPVPYEHMPDLLASFERFVFLPTALEPFGRVVVEAWAAGCEIVTNRLVGARYWIEENPDAMETAAEDFWKLVTA